MPAPSERAVIDRFRAILRGRGADGSVSPQATARAIPAKYFRLSDFDPASTAVDAANLDRAVFIPHESGSDRVPRNIHSPHRNGLIRLVLRIGYVATPAGDAWKSVHGCTTDEERRDAARNWQTRAQDDGRLIARAFEWHELTGADTNPVIENVVYQGTRTNSVDSARGIALVEFELWTESNET